MRCPALSDVATSEFEARAKVDLSVRSPRGGELEVVCDDLAARIRWRARGGASFARSVPPTATSATLIDALLVASKELVEEVSRSETSLGRDPGKSEDEPEPVKTSNADTSDSPPAERAADRPAEKLRKSDRPQGRETAEPPRDRPAAGPATPVEWAFGALLGTQAALFSFRGTGIAGPNVGVFVDLQGRFTASLAGEYDVAVGAGDIASVRAASGTAVIAAGFGPARVFELGVGVLAGSIFVTSELPYSPSSQSQVFWGGVLRGRYAPRLNAWRLAVGPELRFHGFRPEVAVDRATVWGVPAVSFGLALEVSRELFGSR